LVASVTLSSTIEGPPPRPPLPAIKAIELQPAAITIEDARDARRVLVWGITESGERIDLTGVATLTANSPDRPHRRIRPDPHEFEFGLESKGCRFRGQETRKIIAERH
jgi:hypothetical protein